MMIKAAIIGGAGYTAGELMRLLITHPKAEVVHVQSNSHAGQPVFHAHGDLEGYTDLQFSSDWPEEADVVFLCSGHGRSHSLLPELRKHTSARVIDLSADFRVQSGEHDFVYGLPELQRNVIQNSCHIANPGCFATCIQLSLLPLAKAGLLRDHVHVTAITGSTGAGQSLASTTHFSWRSNNASVYKPLRHQHVEEIVQSVTLLQPDFEKDILFVPMRGAFTRGILSHLYTRIEIEPEEAVQLYRSYYRDHPFVVITDQEPDLKKVVQTNRAFLHVAADNGYVMVSGVIDNLLKGASGQAVQNMNLMFGLEETTGLQLKSGAF